jgi:DNA-binding transcriptional MerR regulator
VAKAEPQLYKPADACRMAEVAPYVLRYWETEFPALSEGKEKSGSARLYTAREVQIIARIRQLLYDEGFTVAGAKKRLDSEIQEGRFDGAGEKVSPAKAAASAAPVAPVAPAAPAPARLEDVPLRQAETPAPRPVVAPPKPAPSPVTAAAPAPPSRSAEPPWFAERRTVIKELKEIVRLLEKPKKR